VLLSSDTEAWGSETEALLAVLTEVEDLLSADADTEVLVPFSFDMDSVFPEHAAREKMHVNAMIDVSNFFFMFLLLLYTFNFYTDSR